MVCKKTDKTKKEAKILTFGDEMHKVKKSNERLKNRNKKLLDILENTKVINDSLKEKIRDQKQMIDALNIDVQEGRRNLALLRQEKRELESQIKHVDGQAERLYKAEGAVEAYKHCFDELKIFLRE